MPNAFHNILVLDPPDTQSSLYEPCGRTRYPVAPTLEGPIQSILPTRPCLNHQRCPFHGQKTPNDDNPRNLGPIPSILPTHPCPNHHRCLCHGQKIPNDDNPRNLAFPKQSR